MPEVHNPSAQVVRSRTVQLTAADILALSATPFELVPAPGAGNIIEFFGCGVVYRFGTHPYQPGSGDSLSVNYAGDLANLLVGGSITNMIKQPQSQFAYQPGIITGSVNILPGDDNKAVQLNGADYHGGPIVTATLGAGGAGYAFNDTGIILAGNDDATYKVLSVDGGGAVLTFSITAPGTGYTVANGQPTATGGAQPGVGAGFTVNITAVQNGDGTLKVTTFYSIIPVP